MCTHTIRSIVSNVSLFSARDASPLVLSVEHRVEQRDQLRRAGGNVRSVALPSPILLRLMCIFMLDKQNNSSLAVPRGWTPRPHVPHGGSRGSYDTVG